MLDAWPGNTKPTGVPSEFWLRPRRDSPLPTAASDGEMRIALKCQGSIVGRIGANLDQLLLNGVARGS